MSCFGLGFLLNFAIAAIVIIAIIAIIHAVLPWAFPSFADAAANHPMMRVVWIAIWACVAIGILLLLVHLISCLFGGGFSFR